jgi:hypothetical protein
MVNPAVVRVAAVIARYALSTALTVLLVRSPWLRPGRRPRGRAA